MRLVAWLPLLLLPAGRDVSVGVSWSGDTHALRGGNLRTATGDLTTAASIQPGNEAQPFGEADAPEVCADAALKLREVEPEFRQVLG